MSLLNQWLELPRQKKVILLASLTLFLPFYITCIIHAGLLLYVMATGDLKKAFAGVKSSWVVLPFTAFSIAVSLYYENQVGVLCSIGILIIFTMVIFFHYFGDKALFVQILKLYVFMSILCGIYGMMEYNGILDTLGIEDFEVVIMDSPSARLNSVFFNANYYAMMIEFFVLMASYLLLKEEKKVKIIYYVSVIFFNLFLLYLSGCRTAWPALGLGIAALLIFQKDRRWLWGFMVLFVIIMTIFLVEPSMFPRVDNIGTYFVGRVKIWKVALTHLRTHLFFGEGPLTYMHIYMQYDGATATQHAHNLLIDPFLSYGIIGVALIFPYFKARFDEWRMVKGKPAEKMLMYAVVAATLFHGLLDYTVYFVPTGFTFLMILSSSFIKKNELKLNIQERQTAK